jgi:diguanylate cyclase (GGDEF)-like protein/PAS domain S-box-containing protein
MPSAVLVVAFPIAFFAWKNRQGRAFREFSQEVAQLARESGGLGRIPLAGKPEALGVLGSAVNNLLENLERRSARLDDREQLFHRLVETVRDAVLIHRESILFANSRCLSMLGASADAVLGKPMTEFVTPEYVELVEQNLRRRLAGDPAVERFEVELSGLQGQVTRVELSSTLIVSAGAPALLLTALEMLPVVTVAAPPASARPRSMATLDAMGESVITVDTEGRIDYINQAAAALLGQGFDQVVGKVFADVAALVDEADRRSLGDPVRKALTTGGRVTVGKRAVLVPAGGGAERSVEIGVSPLRLAGGEIVGLVIVLHDTSELRGLTRQMTYQASHDALTGLVNRREFERRLQEAVESAHSGDATHALAYLDLDRFKVVNDTCGHTAGDNLLRELATLLKDAVRDSDTVGRIGGDEFALLLVGCPLEKARQISDDVVRAVGDYRFVWKDKIFNIGVSVGLVEIGRDGSSIEDIMSSADSACYVAKKQGGVHVHVYSAREEANARHRGEIHWLQKLQGSLRDNTFELYHQPIVLTRPDTRPDALRGPALEVFVRLPAENGQMAAPPGEFIRAAERYRLMPHVDRWVVQSVLSALGRGGLKLPPGRSVAINIAGQTLGDAEFLEFVVDCFDHTGAVPGDICFEVTETSVVANLDHARRFIQVLHGMGCEFALDDFGSGLSSFSNLKTLPVDYLKIDGSFIRNLSSDIVNQTVVAAMIDLSRSLNFRVVAEQVEEQSSLDMVRKMGIDFVQGFIIGRPQPLSLAPAPLPL